MSLDGAANTYVSQPLENNESRLVKYGRQGQPEWERKIGIIEERLGAGISADPFGGAATFLTQGSQIGSNSDIEITRYDSEGIKKWSRIIQSNMDDVALGSSIDINRNLFVTGFTFGELRGSRTMHREDVCDYLGDLATDNNLYQRRQPNTYSKALGQENGTRNLVLHYYTY